MPALRVGHYFAEIFTQTNIRRRREVGWKIGWSDEWPLAENRGALESVVESTDVSFPRRALQQLQCFAIDAGNRLAERLGMASQEKRHEIGNIFAAISERRQGDAHNI